MGQILHIFRKDTRRFWVEILLSVSVLLAFVLAAPVLWQANNVTTHISNLQSLAQVLHWLVLASWWLLITRVVQAESMVGENQAWLTRPYEWWKLLSAKVFFLLVYLYVPLALAQCALLRLGGFTVKTHALLLLGGQADLAGRFLLPLLLAAALTANFVRTTLTLLGVILAFIGLLFLGMWWHTEGASIPYQSSHAGMWTNVATLALLIAALVVQYKTRRVWLARGLMLGILVIFGLDAIVPKHSNVDAAYPVLKRGETAAVRFELAPWPGRPVEVQTLRQDASMVQLSLPVEAYGVVPGTAEEVELLKASFDAADGFHWESEWQNTAQRRYVPGLRKSFLEFSINRDVYVRLRGKPVDLHVTLALGRLETVSRARVAMRPTDFAVDALGLCTAEFQDRNKWLRCRTAGQPPQWTLNTVPLSLKGCAAGSARAATGYAWAGQRGVGGDIFLNPVVFEDYFYQEEMNDSSVLPEYAERTLCPGSEMTVTQYRLAGRSRGALDVKGLVLPGETAGFR